MQGEQKLLITLYKFRSHLETIAQFTSKPIIPCGENFTTKVQWLLNNAGLSSIALDEIDMMRRDMVVRKEFQSEKTKDIGNKYCVEGAKVQLTRCNRHLLKQKQKQNLTMRTRKYLDEYFRIIPYPSKSERKAISRACNISPETVRHWVRNTCISFLFASY